MPVTPRRGRNYSKNYSNSNVDSRDETTSARPHQHAIVATRARHRRETLSQVRHVVHAQGLCVSPPAQAAEEGPRAQNQ